MKTTNEGNELLVAVGQFTTLVAVAITRGMKQPEAIDLLGRASLSNEQIAEVLGTTAATVRATRSRLSRPEPVRKAARNGAADA